MFKKSRSAPLVARAEGESDGLAREEGGKKFIRQISGDAWAS
jgi:hypothetical protein